MKSKYYLLLLTLFALLQACVSKNNPTTNQANKATPAVYPQPQKNINKSYLSDIGENKSSVVNVEGVGESLSKAENNAYRNAIQSVFGSLTVSQRKVINDSLTEEDLSYSKGIIEDSRLNKSYVDPNDRLWHVNMTVKVSETALGKKILYSNNSQSINGSDIAKSIRAGKLQIQSEQRRSAEAIQLLNHLASELPLSIWSIRTGKINLSKNGAIIDANILVSLGIDAQVVTNFCEVSKNYQLTGFIPSDGLKILSFDEIGIAYETSNPPPQGCFGSYLIPKNTWEVLASGFKQAGICLAFMSQNKTTIHQNFYPVKIIMIDNDPNYGADTGIDLRLGNYFADNKTRYYDLFNSGKISSDYLNLMRLNYRGGKQTSFSLPVPSNENYYQNVSSIEARVTYRGGCQAQ